MASQEIKGSRKLWTDGKIRRVTQLFISDDGSSDVPVAGELFDLDTGITARVCYNTSKQPEVVPGIYYHQCDFQGWIAYS